MKIKKYIKVIIFTLFFSALSYLNYYPSTGAKYVDTKVGLAKYYLNIKQMYIGKYNDQFTLSENSTYEKIEMQMKFNRSGLYTTDDTLDIYEIEVNSGCTITSVSGGTIKSKTINSNKATIKYETTSIDLISVKYTCPVTSLKNDSKISTRINVYERITPEQTTKHLYLYGTFSQSLIDYYDKHPNISGDKTYSLLSDATSKYTKFKEWISAYADQRVKDGLMLESDKTTFKDYIYSVFSDEASILNTSNTLKGFTISYDSTNKEYTYTIEDSCYGYALTKASMDGKAEVSANSTYYITDKTNARNIFIDYITTYKDKLGYTDTDIANITAYVDSKSGDLTKVKGTTVDENDMYLTITNTSNLINYANTYVNGHVEIPFNTGIKMTQTFTLLFTEFYSEIVQDVTKYSNYSNIRSSLIKNNTKNTSPSTYTDKFLGYDPTYKHWNLITISSDGNKTYASVEKLNTLATLPTISDIQPAISFNVLNDENLKTNTTAIITDLDTIYSALDPSYTNYLTDLTDDFFDVSNYSGETTPTYTNGKITAYNNTTTIKFVLSN